MKNQQKLNWQLKFVNDINTEGIIFLSLGVLFILIPVIISLVKHDTVYMFYSIMSIV